MGNRRWTGRPARVALVMVVAAAGGGAALAVASVPDSSNVIHACVELQPGSTLPLTTPGNVRVIDNSSQTCHTAAAGDIPEQAIQWNVAGATGPQGVAGPTGPQGAAGHTITIAGETFTLSNGHTATIDQEPAIAPLKVDPNGAAVATLTLGTGAGAITSNVLGYSFTGPGASATSGSGAGKANFHEFSITKIVDKSSPKLSEACVSGQHFKRAKLTVRKQGSDAPITYDLQGVVVSTYQTASSGDRPTESLSLNFTKIEYKPTTQGRT